MLGPGRTSTWPAAVSVVRWSPYTSSTCGSSSTPAAIIGSAPPMTSSAGWKMKTDVPATSARRADMISAIVMAIAVCPSWPHACITPFVPDVNGASSRSVSGSASMSARQAMVRPGRSPWRMPTTPGARDPRPHLELGAVQPLGDDLGGAPLLERQLGMAVEVPPERDEPVLPLVHFLRPLDRRLRHGRVLRSSVWEPAESTPDRGPGRERALRSLDRRERRRSRPARRPTGAPVR